MVSTCVDPVLHDLEFVRSEVVKVYHRWYYNYVEILQKNFRLLRIFLLSVRKWGTYEVYLECNDKSNVSLQSLVSSTEDTVKKYAVGIHSLRHSPIEFGHLQNMVYKKSIRSIKLEIIKAYTALLDCSSLQSGPCMRDDELVELVDSLIQSLVDVRSLLNVTIDIFLHAQAKLEAFEDKLLFLKNLVRFSILRGVELGQLEDLLTHIHVVSLKTARLCYTCDAIKSENEICCENEICSLISQQIPKIEPFDLHLFETCIKILRASISSANLKSVARDKHIMRDFNDSLICLCEIMLCSFVSMESVKDQVEILYTGLKFFRNILREPQEKMDQLNEKIGALISEAGVIICSLSMNQVKEGEVNSLDVRDALDCYDMLVNTNSGIQLIKDQISGSSMMGGLPSCHSIKGHAVPKSSSLVPSKRKTAVTHEVVVGFDDDAETLVDRLIRGSRQLEVVPIVGMPGIGKTTLAKKVDKNCSIMSCFHIRLWCCVSQVYDKKILVLQLLCDDDNYSGKKYDDLLQRHYQMLKERKYPGEKKLTLQLLCDDDKHSGMNEDDLLQMLYQKLKGKKYLVVFDDVWDIGFWNDLRLSFPNDENGSRILFTSRFSDVASQVEFGKEPHNLRSLTECESWELLQKKVFGNEDCPPELRKLGDTIAKNCKGLPLTIVIIAGILVTIEYDGWGEVAKSLSSTIVYDTDLCKNTLQMSYEHLPHYLKPCFLYFGAFAEDREIEMEKLMWLWIAEGFVQNTGTTRLEDVAEDYMMDLIRRNLVMVSKEKSMGGVRTCRIHDLLHEFCKSKAKDENFLLMLRGHNELNVFIEPPNLQRLSICSAKEHFEKEHFEKLRIFCPNLSSLLLCDFVELGPKLKMADINLKMADISFICCVYKHLRVLDLLALFLPWMDFPVEINVLVQLRYLAIRGYMTFIPSSVANLSHLQTFLVRNCISCSVSLPGTIGNLKKLRHLHIEGDGDCDFPEDTLENTSSLHNLDTFSRLNVSSGKSLEKIVRKIPNVRQLEIKLSESNQSTSYSRCTLSLDSLNQLESLESLKVCSDHRFWEDIGFIFPSKENLGWDDVEYCYPSTLKELTLGYLYLTWSKISLVEELPSLEVLKLLDGSFKGRTWDMKEGAFPKLRVLCLERLDVVEWTDTDCDGNCFPSLEKVRLARLSKLEKVPSCLGTIPTLETIEVENLRGHESVVSLVQRIRKEQQSFGNENLKILINHI